MKTDWWKWMLAGALLVYAGSRTANAFSRSDPSLGMPIPSYRVAVSERQTMQEQATLQLLTEESERRGAVHWIIQHGRPSSDSAKQNLIVLAQRNQVEGLIPLGLSSAWHSHMTALHPSDRAEGFAIVTLHWRGGAVLIIAGNDERGELFGSGWLLRHMSFSNGKVQLPENIQIYSAPEKPVRGHQIGYRMKNNTYDAWNLAQFEQQIRDLAIFGANTVQLIAPISDDAPSSPLFPATALDTLLGISKILAKYGLDCDLYYPEMGKNYTDPAQVENELKKFEQLVKIMPRLDALYVPGGDPGHTAPGVLFPLLKKEAVIVRKYHPHATVWVSAQGFDAAQYDRFYELLAERQPWLTGVFFGPQSRDSMETQRRRIPQQYALQFYPDIGHTMHAQFPVPEWDPIFALTEGREPICPRPLAFARIYRHFESLHSGFITYSEGINDDVNKILWTELGWASNTSVDRILHEYARWFLHRDGVQETQAVNVILGLESDWIGPLQDSQQIPRTMHLLGSLDRNSVPAQVAGNWRWESLLYRGYYDSYLQHKFVREQRIQVAGLSALRNEAGDSAARVESTKHILASSNPSADEQKEHDKLFVLAKDLFHDGGLQLSVKLYGASNWERGANLDRVDTSLNDRVWMERAMNAALAKPDETQRRAGLRAIVDWQYPTPGAIYDDLGNLTAEPHLVRGLGWTADPEMYETAIDGIADRTLDDGWRLSWLSYGETLYEHPLELEYDDLNPKLQYRIRVTYAGEDYALPLLLTAGNNVEIHPARLRKSNPDVVEFAVPHAAIVGNKLHLIWTRPRGLGGGGRGKQVAEVWLLPQATLLKAQ